MMVACAAVGVLGLITVILGIAGAASSSCDASPAVGCGVVASLLALTTQIVATAATGCCGCCRTWGIPNEAKRIVAVVLSTVSWVLAIIVVILFMVGAILSTGGGLPTYNDGKCVPPGTGSFVAATILFFISMVCQITSYILLQATSVAGSTKSPLAQESGIAMGQPAAAVPASNAEQKAAAAGDLPPSAPTAAAASELPPSAPAAAAGGDLPPPVSTASSEANVDPPPPSAPAMSPKASADPTSHV
ncbi:hypothetical protein VPH35_010955 [Triticum aestivum]